MGGDKSGIILLNLGGPDSIDAVRPFLLNLFSDREIIRLGPSSLQRPIAWLIASSRAGKTKENYRLIGGRSPLLDITQAQARALGKTLNERGQDFKTYVGMKYWHPYIEEALDKMAGDGIKDVIVLPLFPQYSRATTGSCFNELKRAVAKHLQDLKLAYIESWHDHPLYIEAIADSVKHGLDHLSAEENGEVHVLFSAHALPKRFVDEGDPYVDQVKATIDAVNRIIGIESWRLSFQSKSGPVEWIGPSTEEAIKSLAKEGVKRLLMVPISFVSDHVETLYEMDILYKRQAEKMGITLARAPSLNTSPKFIEALADIVEAAWNRGNFNTPSTEEMKS